MPITVPSKDELVNFIQQALKERAGITNFSESSVAGTLANVLAATLSDIYGDLAELEEQTNLSTAYGVYLDKIGDLYGVKRLRNRTATTVGSGASVLFTNPTASIMVVPVHTRVWASGNYNLAFYTETEVSVPAADDNGVAGRQYVDVTAAGTGEAYNIAANTLTNHNVGSLLLQVTNVRAIQNGQDIEGDDNYRYRIQNAILARQGQNETTLRMRLLELPGVRDVDIRPLARGTGTVDAVIVPVDRYVTTQLLEDAQDAAEDAVSLGVSVLVKAPIEHPVDLEIQIAVKASADKTTAKTQVAAAVRSLIDNLPMGNDDGDGDLVMSDVIAYAKNASTDVTEINVSSLKIDNKQANLVSQKALPGEKFYMQSIKVV